MFDTGTETVRLVLLRESVDESVQDERVLLDRALDQERHRSDETIDAERHARRVVLAAERRRTDDIW